MALLKMRPQISQKDLSYLLDIRPQSLGELLAKLERNGYIERTPSEADRRVMDISLTEEGKQAAEGGREPEDSFTCLDDDEKAALGEYLDRVIEELKQEAEACRADRGREWDGERPCPGRRPGHGHGPETAMHGHGPHGCGHGLEGPHGDRHRGGRHGPHRPPHEGAPHHDFARRDRGGYGAEEESEE